MSPSTVATPPPRDTSLLAFVCVASTVSAGLLGGILYALALRAPEPQRAAPAPAPAPVVDRVEATTPPSAPATASTLSTCVAEHGRDLCVGTVLGAQVCAAQANPESQQLITQRGLRIMATMGLTPSDGDTPGARLAARQYVLANCRELIP